MKTTIDKQIVELEYQVQDLKRQISELRRQRQPEEVKDYEFRNSDGQPVHLYDLFGARNRLILIHNMGSGCSYCTMWADGFVGLLPHLESRVAFIVTSPDEPDAQKIFAEARGWNFPMYSVARTDFIADMGFDDPQEGLMPGVSVFAKEAGGKVYRTASGEFGPGDDFCAVWHFLELLPEGIDGWEPKQSYEVVKLARAK